MLKAQKPTLRFLAGVPAVQREVTGTQARSQMPTGKTAAKRAGQGPPFRAEVPRPVALPAPWRGWAVDSSGHRGFVKTDCHFHERLVSLSPWLVHACQCCGAARLAAE